MEHNRPVEILTVLAVLALIVGFVIYDSALTVQGAVDLPLATPLIAVPVGLAFLLLVLFGTRGEQQDG